MKLTLGILSVLFGGSALGQERLFVLDTVPAGTAELVELDPTTGAVIGSRNVTGLEALFGGLAIDDAGDAYSIDGYNDGVSDRTFRIDVATGTGVVVGDTGHNWNFRSIAVNPVDDQIYGWRDNQLYTIDRTTGAATLVAAVTASTLDQGTAFAVSLSGVGYMTDIGNNGLFEVDLTTGSATHLGDLQVGTRWFNDLDFDSSGALFGVHDTGSVYRIDIASVSAQVEFSTSTYTGIAFIRAGGIGTNYCQPATPNSTGLAARMSAAGSLFVADNAVIVTAGELPLSSFGYFLTSQASAFVPGPGMSQGNLCLGGNIGRYVGPGQVQNSGSSGVISLALDLSAMPTPSGFIPATANDTWYFQCWYRDSIGGNATSNFSDGLEIVFQ